MKLSILMPAYNEEQWIEQTVHKVIAQEVPGVTVKELVIVDDCSRDQTPAIIARLKNQYPDVIKNVTHEKNSGKGAAIATAIKEMTGEVCIIQDADWEYEPKDYPLILRPIIDGQADCVYGSRFAGSEAKRVLFFWHMVGNKFLTLLSNMCTNLNLTDMETCYKAFRAELIQSIPLRSQRFGIEPEITAKIARRRARLFEVGIHYNGRTYDEGKKITWVDGFQAIYTILKYCLVDDSKY